LLRARPHFAFAALLLLAVLPACPSGEGESCKEDDDCKGSLVCCPPHAFGACAEECNVAGGGGGGAGGGTGTVDGGSVPDGGGTGGGGAMSDGGGTGGGGAMSDGGNDDGGASDAG
jgi:hypothetical protein